MTGEQTAGSKQQTAEPRRVRVINPASAYHGLQGIIPGSMTPEDGLQVRFPSIDGPVYFRRDELEETGE